MLHYGEFSPSVPSNTSCVFYRFLSSRDNDPHLFCVACRGKEYIINIVAVIAMTGMIQCGKR